jgi:hypothetical protein
MKYKNELEEIKKTILEMALNNYAQLIKIKQSGAASEVLIAEIGAFKRLCVRLGFRKESDELETVLKKIEKLT